MTGAAPSSERRLRVIVERQLDGVSPRDPGDVWERLSVLGVADFTVPADAGGLGAGQRELCRLHEELGVRLCDLRFVRGALCAMEISRAASDAETVAERLRSTATTVDATPLLGDGLGPAAEESGDLTLERSPAAAGECRVRLVGRADPDALELSVSERAVERALDRDRVRVAAYLVGVGRRAHELGRRRASTRMLGGRPLIERQSAAHRVARSALALELARVEVDEAAHQDDGGDDPGVLSRTALAVAIETAQTVTRNAVQLHGAAGTSGLEIGDLYLAAHAAAASWGPPVRLWREAAQRRAADG